MAKETVQPGSIAAEKLCELTGLTDRQHRNIAKQGYFPPPLRGQYQATKTLQGLFRYFQELNKKKSDSVKAAEHRLKTAKAEMAEEELAILRKKYVLKSEIGPALRNVSMHQRAVLQRKLENELGPNLAGLKTPEILVRIKAAVDEICGIFRDGCSSWIDAAPVPEETRIPPISTKGTKAGETPALPGKRKKA